MSVLKNDNINELYRGYVFRTVLLLHIFSITTFIIIVSIFDRRSVGVIGPKQQISH